jgi:hypothetical protein
MPGASTVKVPNSVWNLAGPSFPQASNLRAVSADSSAGDEFFHMGLEDQVRDFGEQIFAFGQGQANLLRSDPDNPSRESSNLNCFNFAPSLSWPRILTTGVDPSTPPESDRDFPLPR